MNHTVLFKKTAIIGLGLIGSSIILAMRERGLTDYVIASDLDIQDRKSVV